MLGELALSFEHSFLVSDDEIAVNTKGVKGCNEFILAINLTIFLAFNQF